MTHEFYYTSVPHGLIKGSKGFCAVAMTKGLPNFLAERLEDLSGYKALFTALDQRNPVNWAHYRLDLGDKTYHVLTRVCAAGLDYSERTNKFVHHVVLAPDELPLAGPAWLLQHKGFLEHAWDQGEPRWLPAGRKPPQGNARPLVCKTWEKLTGDAGWAGVLAETAITSPARPAVVLYEPGTDILALFAEALLLLPEKYRWRVTFSTYASSLPPGESCLWRGLVKGQAEAEKSLHQQGALVITLGKPLGHAEGGLLIEAARTGKAVDVATLTIRPGSRPGTPSARSGQADANDGALPQLSLSSLNSSSRESPDESPDDAPEVSPIRKFLEVGLSVTLGLALAALIILVGEMVTKHSFADFARKRTYNDLLTEVGDQKRAIDDQKSEIAQRDTKIGDLRNEKSNLNTIKSALEVGRKTLEFIKGLVNELKDAAENDIKKAVAAAREEQDKKWEEEKKELKRTIATLTNKKTEPGAKQKPKAEVKDLAFPATKFFLNKGKDHPIKLLDHKDGDEKVEYGLSLRLDVKAEKNFHLKQNDDGTMYTISVRQRDAKKKTKLEPFLTIAIKSSKDSADLILQVPKAAPKIDLDTLKDTLSRLAKGLTVRLLIPVKDKDDDVKVFRLTVKDEMEEEPR